MDQIGIAALIMTALGVLFALVLATAYRFLKVEEDARLEPLEELLPGTNCGACGQPGCHAFAESLLAGENQPGNCTVSGPDALDSIAGFLGVDVGGGEKIIARLACAGGASSVGDLAEYRGISSCRAAVLVNGGERDCTFGCLGLGDCDVVCTFNAIHMNSEHLPVVTPELCTACNDCVEVCPLDLFSLVPMSQKLFVQCSSPLEGDASRNRCTVTCDACGRCALDAAPGLIEMKNGLPVINTSLIATQDEAAIWRCPTGAIQWLDGQQFADKEVPGLAKPSVSTVPEILSEGKPNV